MPSTVGALTWLKPSWPPKIEIVLLHQIVERYADRDGDHDRVDAFGTHREPADEAPEHGGDDDGDRHRDPPGPAQAAGAALGLAGDAEDRHHVAGQPGDRHLGDRHHAAIAAEEGQRERDQSQREGLSADLIDEERRGDPGIDQHRQQDDHVADADRADGATEDRTGAGRLRRHGRRVAWRRHHRPARRTRPGVAAGTGIHRPPPLGGAHAVLRPRMPVGRKASTSTMMRNVKTTP